MTANSTSAPAATGRPAPGAPWPNGVADVAEQGRICALAVRGLRDLQDVVARHAALFAAPTFDPALLSSVATAIAFTAPWYPAERLRTTTRTLLWVFAADWLIDTRAESAAEVRNTVAACLAVADGAPAPADSPLAALLAELRADLGAAPAYGDLAPVWREELAAMFAAVAREWDWKHLPAGSAELPDLDGYLANADNLACSFVNVTHWIAVGDPDCRAHLAELRSVGRDVQQVLRLVNDLATHRRDVAWGDLNALALVADPALVNARLAQLTRRCEERIAGLADRVPRQAAYLHRQIAYTSGFYQVSDFWGPA
ncbi:terpene synthase family protein [Micromonospora yasonensis]|uniref:terpene synthase family protein n=1 Tax=Micromonospora yasonensis TaxID=1128667 RepID=UPI00222F8E44|nr:terpene synthase family protein [Micromonospora yasonensis]MCW3844556.1 terpene synthase family protein [Micromonospora yasonensis]